MTWLLGTPLLRSASVVALLPRTPPRRPILQVNLVQSCHQRRTNEQVIVPTAGWHAPQQQLAQSGENLIGAGRQLMPVDPRDVRPVLGVLLEAPPLSNPTKAQPRFDVVFR
jgi:hypothetical protein